MPKTLAEITRDAAELSEPERLKLARILLELSGPEPPDLAGVEEAWETEIQGRLQNLRAGRVKGVPFEEVMSQIEVRPRS
jgi:putative addiction module component (TIGR02574 family)